jgi:hypothetical protein
MTIIPLSLSFPWTREPPESKLAGGRCLPSRRCPRSCSCLQPAADPCRTGPVPGPAPHQALGTHDHGCSCARRSAGATGGAGRASQAHAGDEEGDDGAPIDMAMIAVSGFRWLPRAAVHFFFLCSLLSSLLPWRCALSCLFPV